MFFKGSELFLFLKSELVLNNFFGTALVAMSCTEDTGSQRKLQNDLRAFLLATFQEM